MMDEDNTLLNEYKTNVKCGRYLLDVITKEVYWKGDPSTFKMEDLPGNFLESEVYLIAVEGKATSLETLAFEKRATLLEKIRRGEVTQEPLGYSQLYHNSLVEKLKERDESYWNNKIQAEVKKKL